MLIYYFDNENKKYSGFDTVPDTVTDEQGQEQPYPIPDNATNIKPDFSLLGLYFDVENQAWKGLSQEEYDKQNPPQPPDDWEEPIDYKAEFEKLKAEQEATAQAVQDLILTTMNA